MKKQITRVWSFASDSNPNIEYETLQYTDGTTSCNCMGWTRRVAVDGTRSCKHTRYVVSGTRDAGQVRRRSGFCRFTGLSLAGLPVGGEKFPNLAAGH